MWILNNNSNIVYIMKIQRKKVLSKRTMKRTSKRSHSHYKKTNKTRSKRLNWKKTPFSNDIQFQKGGNINPPSFQPFQSSQDQYYYAKNDYMNDPSDPSILVSARNIPMLGGKKTRRKKDNKNKKQKKMKGGDPILGTGPTNNVFTSFGNYEGSFIGKTLASAMPLPVNSVIDQPSYHTYNEHRLPKV